MGQTKASCSAAIATVNPTRYRVTYAQGCSRSVSQDGFNPLSGQVRLVGGPIMYKGRIAPHVKNLIDTHPRQMTPNVWCQCRQLTHPHAASGFPNQTRVLGLLRYIDTAKLVGHRNMLPECATSMLPKRQRHTSRSPN